MTSKMRHTPPRRLWAALQLACVLVLGPGLATGCREARGDKVTLPPKPAKNATTAASADATSSPAGGPAATSTDGAIKLTGTTAAHRQSLVSVTGAGLIQQLLVREGDIVKKGQVIARLDASGAVLRLQQAKAALELAKVQLAAAERERGRLERLQKDQAVAGAQVDQATTGNDAAAAGVAQAEAAVAMTSKMVADCVVYAPFAGLVVKRLKAAGEWVSTMPPAPIIMLAEIDPLDLTIQAPEHLLPQIREGDPVSIHFAAVDQRVDASVTRIVPMVMPPTRSFTVIVELSNPDGELQPGLFAEVEWKPRAKPAGADEQQGDEPVAKAEDGK